MKRRSDNLENFIRHVKSERFFSLDTETTGLLAYSGHIPFSLQISTQERDFYFTNPEDWGAILQHLDKKENTLFIHNAKFDLHMLHAMTAFRFKYAEIWDTLALHRLMNNNLKAYNLYACCAHAKIPANISTETEVLDFIEKNKLKQHKKTRYDAVYHLVDDIIMSKYAIEDTRLTLTLGLWQQEKLIKPELMNIIALEQRVTRVLETIERTGLLVDQGYIKTQRTKLLEQADKTKSKIEQIIGKPFVDSAKENRVTFGTKSAAKAVLETITDHPAAPLILEHRALKKVADTYFGSWLELLGSDGRLHPSFQQSVTTGRMSCSQPNLQTLNKTDNEDLKVKKGIVPTHGYILVQMDYSSQEYRLALDYAEEMELIKKVKNGLDIHSATAELLTEKTGKDFSRKKAKTINFLLLYGGGTQKLADSLGISFEEAKELKEIYFSQLPKIREFVDSVRETLKNRGYIKTYSGRPLYYHSYWLSVDKIDEEEWETMPDWKRLRLDRDGGIVIDNSNKALNSLIQGSSADITKIALINVHDFLADKKSRIVLTVHDSIVYEIHETEVHLIKDLEKIMIDAYKPTHLPMAVETTIGIRNLEEEVVYEEYIRNIAS